MHNENTRLEFFCDGVFAIAITLLVLEIKVPHVEEHSSAQQLWLALDRLWPNLLAWLLSFLIIFLMWLSHHRVLRHISKSSLPFMYANGFFLLTITLFPFATALVAEYLTTEQATPAVAIYCLCNLLLSIGMLILLASTFRPVPLSIDSRHTQVLRAMLNGPKISIPSCILAFAISFWLPRTAFLLMIAFWSIILFRTFWLQKQFDKL